MGRVRPQAPGGQRPKQAPHPRRFGRFVLWFLCSSQKFLLLLFLQFYDFLCASNLTLGCFVKVGSRYSPYQHALSKRSPHLGLRQGLAHPHRVEDVSDPAPESFLVDPSASRRQAVEPEQLPHRCYPSSRWCRGFLLVSLFSLLQCVYQGILEHTLFKGTYFPTWEGLFWY